jgi:hypothetical protein
MRCKKALAWMVVWKRPIEGKSWRHQEMKLTTKWRRPIFMRKLNRDE